jgi:hypothetical protein
MTNEIKLLKVLNLIPSNLKTLSQADIKALFTMLRGVADK